MKKRLSLFLALILMITAFAGCEGTKSDTTDEESSSSSSHVSSETSSEEPSSSTSSTSPSSSSSSSQASSSSSKVTSTAASQSTTKKTIAAPGNTPIPTTLVNLKISGSTSVLPLMKALIEKFTQDHKNYNIQLVNVTGSGSGRSDAAQKKVDFGMASSALGSADKTILDSQQIATDAVAIIVNKDNNIDKITRDQLLGLYVGTVTDRTKAWSTLSSSVEGNVATYGRDSASGTRECFESVVLGKSKGASANLNADLDSTDAVINGVAGNTKAIGYASLGDCLSAISNGKNIKMLKLSFDGTTFMEPSLDNAANGSYKATRPFLLLWAKGTTPSQGAKAFLEFILSSNGQAIVSAKKFVKIG